MDRSGAAERRGAFILVVGPSGAGKDTVIEYARRELGADPRFLFARRVVTRQAADEDHDTMTASAFVAAEKAGAFALSWHSHGLHYGIPADVTDHANAGRIVVINASRGVIADAVRIAPRVFVAHVTAPAAILAARLAARGRETADDIERRLQREVAIDGAGADVVIIDNGGTTDAAGNAFLSLLLRVARLNGS